jgi:large subunit ribosomal protein L22
MPSTIINKSPRKVRLIINPIKGMSVSQALQALATMPKGKTKKVYDLVKNATNNMKLTEADYDKYVVSSIVAQEAQKLYRVVPRARGSAFRIRRRYTRVILELGLKNQLVAKAAKTIEEMAPTADKIKHKPTKKTATSTKTKKTTESKSEVVELTK